MRLPIALTILLLASGPAAAQVGAPAILGSTSVPRDSLVELRVTSVPDGAAVTWDVIPEETVTVREVKFDATGKPDAVLLFNGPPGAYSVKAQIHTYDPDRKKLDVQTLRVKVAIGKEPGPSPPGPGPGPNPPVPPVPPDPLAAELQGLFKADPSPSKLADAKALVELYKMMAAECPKDSYPTAASLNAKYRSAADLMLPGKLLPLRRRAAKEIESILPGDPDTPLTPDLRKSLAAAYTKLGKALEDAVR